LLLTLVHETAHLRYQLGLSKGENVGNEEGYAMRIEDGFLRFLLNNYHTTIAAVLGVDRPTIERQLGILAARIKARQ